MRLTPSHSIRLSALALTAVCALAVGCTRAPGRPGPEPEVVRPDQVLNFSTLYKQNCAACHGEDGKNGVSLPLSNPVYLSLAGESTLNQITARGVPGTLMPPFGKSAGGMLTDQQITVLAQGMLHAWAKPDLLTGQSPPPYSSTLPGDSARGQQAYTTFCAHCHGADGKGAPGDPKTGSGKLGSIVDPSYLALVSDQSLRSMIIAGLPDRGMPDWRSDSAQPLTDQQTADIVAWLASQRTTDPGQPYPRHP